jgi:hypothetical protein
MAYFIHARDGAGLVVLMRETEEAALEKAAELKEVGWLEVEVFRDEQAPAKAALAPFPPQSTSRSSLRMARTGASMGHATLTHRCYPERQTAGTSIPVTCTSAPSRGE